VIANQQQNCSYQDQHSSDAKCHQPQSTTRSGVRFFLQEGGSTIAALLYIWGQVDSSHPFLSSQVPLRSTLEGAWRLSVCDVGAVLFSIG
jgi:hypothetical protein